MDFREGLVVVRKGLVGRQDKVVLGEGAPVEGLPKRQCFRVRILEVANAGTEDLGNVAAKRLPREVLLGLP